MPGTSISILPLEKEKHAIPPGTSLFLTVHEPLAGTLSIHIHTGGGN